MENCRMCKFWKNGEPMKISPDAQGACRRFPPVPMVVPMPHPAIKNTQILSIQSNYAGTRAKDWCGEFVKSDVYTAANALGEESKSSLLGTSGGAAPLASPSASGGAGKTPPEQDDHQE